MERNGKKMNNVKPIYKSLNILILLLTLFVTICGIPDYHGKGIGKRLVQFLERDEWCLCSNLIEIPSSKSSHGFYYKCGYKYRNYPPVFSEADGSTIMYKKMTPQA